MKKVDKSLEEVWEMKNKLYEDFIKSGYKNYSSFIENTTQDIRKKYNIKYRNERNEKQLETA